MNKYKNPILSVFRTYTDCYLEYVNNWVTLEAFCSFYSISEADFRVLASAVHELRKNGGKWLELDYFYNLIWNNQFTEKKAIY